MTEEDAVRQLNRFDHWNKKKISLRTRRLILQAVASGAEKVSFHGLGVNLDSKGIKVAAGILRDHPCAWIEVVPDVLEQSDVITAPALVDTDPRPLFGL
jgi:hypothetical protein